MIDTIIDSEFLTATPLTDTFLTGIVHNNPFFWPPDEGTFIPSEDNVLPLYEGSTYIRGNIILELLIFLIFSVNNLSIYKHHTYTHPPIPSIE